MTGAHTLAARSSSILTLLTSSLPHPTQTDPTTCTREQGPQEAEDQLQMEEEVEVEWEEEERQSTKRRSN
jgi:hypothetical protein